MESVLEQTAKAQIRLHECAVWSEPLLFVHVLKQISLGPGSVWSVNMAASS